MMEKEAKDVNFLQTNGRTYSPIGSKSLLNSDSHLSWVSHSCKFRQIASASSDSTLTINRRHQNGKEKGSKRKEGSQDLQDQVLPMSHSRGRRSSQARSQPLWLFREPIWSTGRLLVLSCQQEVGRHLGGWNTLRIPRESQEIHEGELPRGPSAIRYSPPEFFSIV